MACSLGMRAQALAPSLCSRPRCAPPLPLASCVLALSWSLSGVPKRHGCALGRCARACAGAARAGTPRRVYRAQIAPERTDVPFSNFPRVSIYYLVRMIWVGVRGAWGVLRPQATSDLHLRLGRGPLGGTRTPAEQRHPAVATPRGRNSPRTPDSQHSTTQVQRNAPRLSCTPPESQNKEKPNLRSVRLVSVARQPRSGVRREHASYDPMDSLREANTVKYDTWAPRHVTIPARIRVRHLLTSPANPVPASSPAGNSIG